MLCAELFGDERVRLAAFTKADVPEVASWYSDAEFMRYYDAEAAFPKTEDDVERMIADAHKNPNSFWFAIRRRPDDALIGLGAVEEISWRDRVGWLSIALARPYWSQGLGSHAFGLLLQYAFQELNLHRVQLTTFEYNQRALAVYHKFGFVHEGTFRERIERDGRRFDMYLMGLLASEWRARGVPETSPGAIISVSDPAR
ncbi:MAG: GNAT family N-acetyltransferase [Anaerolineae bacterium]